jgi:hypothetical protein
MPTSPWGVEWEPSDRQTPGADFDNAKAYFKMPGVSEWVEHFDRSPETVQRFLLDIFQTVRSEEARGRGTPISGRRRRYLNYGDATYEEVMDQAYPQYSMDPFPIAVRTLQGSMSFLAFATRAGVPRRTLDHMITGKIKLNPHWLERLALTSGVTPAFFREYREMAILVAMSELLETNPNMSVRWIRAMRVRA